MVEVAAVCACHRKNKDQATEMGREIGFVSSKFFSLLQASLQVVSSTSKYNLVENSEGLRKLLYTPKVSFFAKPNQEPKRTEPRSSCCRKLWQPP